jgi:hypothetical protein
MLTAGAERRLTMTKILIGMATAAFWFVLSHAANAERICREVCDHGTCVSRCANRPDADVTVRGREHWRHHDSGMDVDTPTGDVTIHR